MHCEYSSPTVYRGQLLTRIYTHTHIHYENHTKLRLRLLSVFFFTRILLLYIPWLHFDYHKDVKNCIHNCGRECTNGLTLMYSTDS
uniref:Uncharacterized protein n=1 Tax=Anguilla anguilla TaxID=7936 RepID=A0A0E9XM75_ANGAN